jgi:hypothetical protein
MLPSNFSHYLKLRHAKYGEQHGEQENHGLWYQSSLKTLMETVLWHAVLRTVL